MNPPARIFYHRPNAACAAEPRVCTLAPNFHVSHFHAAASKWLQPVVSPDPGDPKLAHLDGLNLSRAWMLEGIAAGLPKADKRLPSIMATPEAHKSAGLAAVTG
jgi:hypothetical protein